MDSTLANYCRCASIESRNLPLVFAPFCLLQVQQVFYALSIVLLPPRDFGMEWSISERVGPVLVPQIRTCLRFPFELSL